MIGNPCLESPYMRTDIGLRKTDRDKQHTRELLSLRIVGLDQSGEIAIITGYYDSILLRCASEYISIRCPRKANVQHMCDVGTAFLERVAGWLTHVLIEQEAKRNQPERRARSRATRSFSAIHPVISSGKRSE